MAKKLKKVNEVKSLKQDIKNWEENYRSTKAENLRLERILDLCKEVLGDRIDTYQIPVAVAKLKAFRDMIEGSTSGMREEIESLREIIRWHINPASASNSAELKAMRKRINDRFGPGRI